MNLLAQSNAIKGFARQTPLYMRQGLFLLGLLVALCVALFLNRSPEPTWTSGAYDQSIENEK